MAYNELKHYGILGMKWGIRRYQNSDGSLTSEGKKRYGSEKPKETFFQRITNKAQRHNQTEAAKALKSGSAYSKDEVRAYAKNLVSSADKTAMDAYTKTISDLGNELSTDYPKYYKSLANNSDFKERVWDKLHEDFGIGVDDIELFDWEKEDRIKEVAMDMRPKTLVDKENKLLGAVDGYFKEVKILADGLVTKYGDKPIADPKLPRSPKYVMTDRDRTQFITEHLDDSAWNSYVGRHYYDYWVDDVQELYDLNDLFTASEYNKRFSSGR